MLSKSSSKVLWIVLVVLVALFLILKFTDRSERTIRENLVSVDTARINRIEIKQPANGGHVELLKKNGNWQVKEQERFFKADNRKVRSLLTEISALKPQSIAATSSEKWDKYKVSDSTGTRIQFKQGDEIRADLILGRINFRVPKQESQNPYMRRQQEILMYVRPYEDENVYVTDGMVKLGLGSKPDDYRQKMLCRVNADEIKSVDFSYPGKSSFTVRQQDNKWLLDDSPADSAKTVNYVRKLKNAMGNRFIHDFNPENQNVYGKITINLDGRAPVVLTAYQTDSTHYIVHSSMNEESYFDGNSGKLFERYFVGKDTFEKGGS
ncbi:MAG: DUF4340 domain-containing protein [Chlorobi bacterium]|nr:DUF4340 domain-containing protein [Chlorobiota bacterium]